MFEIENLVFVGSKIDKTTFIWREKLYFYKNKLKKLCHVLKSGDFEQGLAIFGLSCLVLKRQHVYLEEMTHLNFICLKARTARSSYV